MSWESLKPRPGETQAEFKIRMNSAYPALGSPHNVFYNNNEGSVDMNTVVNPDCKVTSHCMDDPASRNVAMVIKTFYHLTDGQLPWDRYDYRLLPRGDSERFIICPGGCLATKPDFINHYEDAREYDIYFSRQLMSDGIMESPKEIFRHRVIFYFMGGEKPRQKFEAHSFVKILPDPNAPIRNQREEEGIVLSTPLSRDEGIRWDLYRIAIIADGKICQITKNDIHESRLVAIPTPSPRLGEKLCEDLNLRYQSRT